jgi:hypothetical protein
MWQGHEVRHTATAIRRSPNKTMDVTGEACASIEAHKSFSTSGRLAPLAIISSVRFSAARRDSACDGVVVFSPGPDSDPPGCARLAALLSCMSWSGVRCNSGELIVFSIWGPVYDSFVINKCSRTAHSPGAHDLIQSSECLCYLRMSITQASRASCWIAYWRV